MRSNVRQPSFKERDVHIAKLSQSISSGSSLPLLLQWTGKGEDPDLVHRIRTLQTWRHGQRVSDGLLVYWLCWLINRNTLPGQFARFVLFKSHDGSPVNDTEHRKLNQDIWAFIYMCDAPLSNVRTHKSRVRQWTDLQGVQGG